MEAGRTISLCYIISSRLYKVFHHFRVLINLFVIYRLKHVFILLFRLLIFSPHLIISLLLSINFQLSWIFRITHRYIHVDLDHRIVVIKLLIPLKKKKKLEQLRNLEKRNLEKIFVANNKLDTRRTLERVIYIHIKWRRGIKTRAKKSNQILGRILTNTDSRPTLSWLSIVDLHRLIQAHQQKHSLNLGRVSVPFK